MIVVLLIQEYQRLDRIDFPDQLHIQLYDENGNLLQNNNFNYILILKMELQKLFN